MFYLHGNVSTNTHSKHEAVVKTLLHLLSQRVGWKICLRLLWAGLISLALQYFTSCRGVEPSIWHDGDYDLRPPTPSGCLFLYCIFETILKWHLQLRIQGGCLSVGMVHSKLSVKIWQWLGRCCEYLAFGFPHTGFALQETRCDHWTAGRQPRGCF